MVKKILAKLIFGFIVLLLIAAIVLIVLLWKGIVPVKEGGGSKTYNVKGVDVSHYQGDIDWKKLSSQNISFAFIILHII